MDISPTPPATLGKAQTLRPYREFQLVPSWNDWARSLIAQAGGRVTGKEVPVSNESPIVSCREGSFDGALEEEEENATLD